jgi:RNA recognition motif-containing protein
MDLSRGLSFPERLDCSISIGILNFERARDMMPGQPLEEDASVEHVASPLATTDLPRQKKTLYARPSPTAPSVEAIETPADTPLDTPVDSAQESSVVDTSQGETLSDAWTTQEPPLVPTDSSQEVGDSQQQQIMTEDTSEQQQHDNSTAVQATSKYSMGPRDPSILSQKNARVYVGNLAYETGWEELKTLMEEAGTVVHVDIMTMDGGSKSKGCGIVEFSSPEEAQKAIKELNERDLMGRPVFLREDRESKAGFSSSSGVTSGGVSRDAGRQLFVGNLAYEIAWQDLKDFFRGAGAIIRADVAQAGGRSKGCGTVLFETIEDAQRAICKSFFLLLRCVYVAVQLLLEVDASYQLEKRRKKKTKILIVHVPYIKAMFNGQEWKGRRIEVREVGFSLTWRSILGTIGWAHMGFVD